MSEKKTILLVALFLPLFLIAIFLIRKGNWWFERHIKEPIENIIYHRTSTENLRSKNMVAFNEYTQNHKKIYVEEKYNTADHSELYISYELDQMQDLYDWYKLATSSANPSITYYSNSTEYYVTSNDFLITSKLNVYKQADAYGKIGYWSYSDKNQGQTISIDFYIPESIYLRDF